jgi:hypothetical protein
MPTIAAQVRPDFKYVKDRAFEVKVPDGFEGTFALSYAASDTYPGGEYTVVLYADREASSVQVAFASDFSILIDVPAGFQQSGLVDVINTWLFAGNGSGGGAPGGVKTKP